MIRYAAGRVQILPQIYYGGCLYPPEDRYNLIDGDYIGGLAGQLAP